MLVNNTTDVDMSTFNTTDVNSTDQNDTIPLEVLRSTFDLLLESKPFAPLDIFFTMGNIFIIIVLCRSELMGALSFYPLISKAIAGMCQHTLLVVRKFCPIEKIKWLSLNFQTMVLGTSNVSFLSSILVAFNLYLALCKAPIYKIIMPKRRILLLVACTWIINAIFVICPMITVWYTGSRMPLWLIIFKIVITDLVPVGGTLIFHSRIVSFKRIYSGVTARQAVNVDKLVKFTSAMTKISFINAIVYLLIELLRVLPYGVKELNSWGLRVGLEVTFSLLSAMELGVYFTCCIPFRNAALQMVTSKCCNSCGLNVESIWMTGSSQVAPLQYPSDAPAPALMTGRVGCMNELDLVSLSKGESSSKQVRKLLPALGRRRMPKETSTTRTSRANPSNSAVQSLNEE